MKKILSTVLNNIAGADLISAKGFTFAAVRPGDSGGVTYITQTTTNESHPKVAIGINSTVYVDESASFGVRFTPTILEFYKSNSNL